MTKRARLTIRGGDRLRARDVASREILNEFVEWSEKCDRDGTIYSWADLLARARTVLGRTASGRDTVSSRRPARIRRNDEEPHARLREMELSTDALERLASCVKGGVLQMRDVDRASVYSKHLGGKLRR